MIWAWIKCEWSKVDQFYYSDSVYWNLKIHSPKPVYIYMACFRTGQNFNWNMSVFCFQFWYSDFSPICLIDLIQNVSENKQHSSFRQIVKTLMGRGYLPGLLALILPFLKNVSTLDQNYHILKVVSVKSKVVIRN